MFDVYNPMNASVDIIEYSWNRKWRRYQRTKSCSGYSWRRQYFHNMNRSRRFEDMLRNDDEYRKYCREYHVSVNVFNHNDPPIKWWDEKFRRIEGNWKSQYKVNRQYNIHKGARTSESIRNTISADVEYTQEDIDDMMEMEFENKESV